VFRGWLKSLSNRVDLFHDINECVFLFSFLFNFFLNLLNLFNLISFIFFCFVSFYIFLNLNVARSLDWSNYSFESYFFCDKKILFFFFAVFFDSINNINVVFRFSFFSIALFNLFFNFFIIIFFLVFFFNSFFKDWVISWLLRQSSL